MEKEMLKMNLQMFAEGDIIEEDEAGNEKSKDNVQTVTVEEMQRRLSNADKKHKEEIENLKSTFTDELNKKLEEFKAESELTGKELEKFKMQQLEDEKSKLREEIDRLKQDQIKREMTDEAIKVLSDKKLPISDKVLSFVVHGTAEETSAAISDFEDIIKEVKESLTSSVKPKTSGGFTTQVESKNGNEILDSAKITSF